MKPNTTITDLENIKIQPIDMQHHRTELRKALLTSSYWNKRTSLKDFLVKGGEDIMQKNKFISVGIAISAMTVVLIIVIGLMSKNTTTAYAEQLAQKSFQAVSNLTPGQLQALKQKLPIDPSELLQEAKNAKDLKTLTYDQFVSQYPHIKMGLHTGGGNAMYGPIPSDLGTPETIDMHNFKFLQFTDSKGNNVVLGIDKGNLPVFMFGTGKDGSSFGVVHRPGGTKGPMSGSVMIEGDGKAGVPDMKSGGFGVSSSDGKILNVNGKEYIIPTGASEESTVQIVNGDVYINGIKATLKQ